MPSPPSPRIRAPLRAVHLHSRTRAPTQGLTSGQLSRGSRVCVQTAGSARACTPSVPGALLPSPPKVSTPRPWGLQLQTVAWGGGWGRPGRARRRGRGSLWAPHAAPAARSNFPSRGPLGTPPVSRRAGATPPPALRPPPPASPAPPPALPAPAPTGNLRSRSERMCYNLGAAAADTAPAPAPEPKPKPEPKPEPPPPRLPGRPRARSARSPPPPPRARPALDAVSAAARLPPAPLRSRSQAEPSPAGSGRGGQGARGRRSVWSQRARRRKRRRKEGKPPPPPPPRSGIWARALLSPATVAPAPGPHPGPGMRGTVGEGAARDCRGGGPLCRSSGAGGSPPLGEAGKMLSPASVGAGAGSPAALAARAAPAPAPCPGRTRRDRVPPLVSLRLRRFGSAISGHPPQHTHPGFRGGRTRS